MQVNGWTIEAAESLFEMKAVDDKVRKELIRTLLEVYMSEDVEEGSRNAKEKDEKRRARDQERASNLMNSQAMNLDVLDV